MIKSYKMMLAALFCLLGFAVGWAQSFTVGGIGYDILSASTVGIHADSYSGEIIIPATVENDGVTYTVTTVGSVFKNNTAVTKLKLPETVTSLPASCFAGMTGLLEVEIPNVENLPDYLVDGCSSLNTLTLGAGVHMASSHMTRNCNSLTKVTMLYEDVVGWNAPSSFAGSSIPAQYKPIANNIQGQSTLYIPAGTTTAYQNKKNSGYGSVTLWNKFGTYVELDPSSNVDVESITISPANPVLAAEEGATVQLSATVLPENATDKTIVWTTSDASVATVSNTGLVTRTAPLINAGDQPYTVTITASGANDVVATVTVTAEVLADIPVSSITIAPENPVLAATAGSTVQLTATPLPENALNKTITWSSADETIATVDANGLVTRVAPLYNNDVPFIVDITATAFSGVTQTVTVTAEVLETVLPTSISITPEEPVLAAVAGSTVQLSVNYLPENTTDRFASWSSADETIATVDQNGLVTRTAPLTSEDEQPYTVVITATTPNGLTANVTVTANVKGDEFFCEDGIYYNVISADNLTVEVTNSIGGTSNDVTCYSGEIEIPATVTHKGRTYNVIRIGSRAFCDNELVTKLTLNEGLQQIDAYGIRGMKLIHELELPNTVTTLPAFALARLGAETIVIPNVADLPQSLMSGCSVLKNLVLGAAVSTLGNNMTKDVTTIEVVTCMAPTPPVWDGGSASFAPFAGSINNAKLIVPEGSRDAYYNARATYSGTTTYYWRFGTIEEVSPVTRVHIAEAEHGTVEADELNPEDGATVTLTVTPEAGYNLKTISVEAVIDAGNAQAPRRAEGPGVGVPVALTTVTAGQTYTFVMPAAPYDVIVESEFEEAEYTVTVAQGIEHGTVAADKATAHYGEAVTLTVTPNTGYELETLTYTVEGNDPVNIVNNTFNMPAANVTINATFKAIDYTITVAQTENGTVEAPATANYDDAVEVTVTPATGYELATLTYTVEGAEPVAIENNTFTMPAATVTINATFAAIDYTITVAQTENGTVQAPASANYGETVNVTATPNTGYELATLTYTVGDADPVVIENNQFEMPAANVTINATFAAVDYTITVAQTENGTVQAPASANYGETVNLTVTPATGYELATLTYTAEGGEAVPIENNAFEMPAANVTINATFAAVDYTITVAQTENGTVQAPASANYGETVNLTVTPATGYELETLTYTAEGGESVNIENNTFEMPAANVTINATFAAVDYTITVTPTENGTVEAPATANYGDVVALTVTPAEGYQLKTLTVMNGETEVETTETETGATFEMPAGNVTVTAEFEFIPIVLDGVVFAGNTYATWYGNQNLALPEGVTAYVVTGIEGDASQIEEVSYIPANVGVLLYSTATAESVSTVPYTGETATVTSMLQGTLEEMEITDGYVLYQDVFVLTKAGSLAAHRCYLPVPAEGAHGAPMLLRIVHNGDVVTAINDVRVAGDGNVRYIDINGRVSDKPFQGVNIVINADGTVTKMVK